LESFYATNVRPNTDSMVFTSRLSGKQTIGSNLHRSLKMDRWKLKEVRQMELGGNKAAMEYFE